MICLQQSTTLVAFRRFIAIIRQRESEAFMTQKNLNMSSENHTVVLKVSEMAQQENRTLANMASVLLYEAIAARKASDQGHTDGA